MDLIVDILSHPIYKIIIIIVVILIIMKVLDR